MRRLKKIATVALLPVLICAWIAAHGGLPVPDGAEFQISTDVEYNKERVALAVHPDGRMIAAWSSFGQDGHGLGIFAQRYNADGSAAGGEFQVNVQTSQHQAYPAVGVDGVGNFVVAWQSHYSTAPGIYARRYAATGTPLGGEFQVVNISAAQARPPAIDVATSGEFVVLWEGAIPGEGWAFFGQRFDATGAPDGDEFQVNEQAQHNQTQPASVAYYPDGEFLVVWARNLGGGWNIAARRFDTDGDPVGSEYQINEISNDGHTRPVIAVNANGDGMVTWQSTGTESPFLRSVRGRRLDGDGLPAGAGFRINQYDQSYQETPDVAIDASGNALAVWASAGQDGSHWSIYARYLPANGTRCLPEFRVNTTFEDSQFQPAVVLADNGRALAAWHNSTSPNRERILGQRYNPPAALFRDRFEHCPTDE